MPKKKSFLKENGTKIMALASAGLMIAFFIPSLSRSGGNANDRSGATFATLLDNQSISVLEAKGLRDEWDEVSRRLELMDPETREPKRAAVLALGDEATAAIEAKPDSFLILVKEAQNMGITVSNDQFQQTLHSTIGLPDEGDPESGYDHAAHSIYDMLLVGNLLDRVAGELKISQPRAIQELASTQQEIALNIIQLPVQRYLAATTQPTAAQVQNQYDHFSSALPDSPDAANPLGFGYTLPDRVKIQYIGFSLTDLRGTVKASKPIIEWQTQARRLYRTHPSDFTSPSTQPTTQPAAAVAWEDLPADIVTKVYDRVYELAAHDVAQKILARLNEKMAADWNSYHNAAGGGSAIPVTDLGAAFNSDEYLTKLAASIQTDFSVTPILGIDNNGWKTARDLASLPQIGSAQTNAGESFALYATTHGDKFTSAQTLPISERLQQWQPSSAVYTNVVANEPDGIFIYRLTDLDPSHVEPLAEAKGQVMDDLRTKQEWDAALTDAATALNTAKESGLDAADHILSPPPPMVNTGFFIPARATDKVPALSVKPASAALVAAAAKDLLLHPPTAPQHPAAEVDLPLDREVALIEMSQARALWQDSSDRLMEQSKLAVMEWYQTARGIRYQWALYDNAVKRTGYKEVGK
jgi:hypothetical protein